MVTTGLTLAPFPLTSRSNAEAKALLAQTVSALKPDKAKTLDEIRKGEVVSLIANIHLVST